MKKIKKIETKIEELQISEEVIGVIKESIFTEIVCLYYNLHQL